MERIAVIGGGLTGLSAAWYTAGAKPDWHIEVFEKEPSFGGKIKTKRVDGYVVEIGPDSYLARKTAMTDLITELGLGDTIVSNATGQAYIYDKGKMYPIPGGSIVGVPTEIIPFAISTLLSPLGKLQAAADWFKPPYPTEGDVSIGDFFRYHLGQEMMDKLIEPLLSGIYGGDIYKLSLLATFPEFYRMEQKYGNMLKGVLAVKRERSKTPVKESSQFRQLTGGLASVIDELVAQMPKNVVLQPGQTVESIERQTDGTYKLIISGSAHFYDKVIITTPPRAYRDWFGSEEGFDPITRMEQSSCAIAVMSFDKESFDAAPQGTGFLITRKTSTPLTACTYMSVKWPQTTPRDKVVIRVFMGKAGDRTINSLDEEQLSALALREIRHIMKFKAEPLWIETSRLADSMPQYHVGHGERIKQARAYAASRYPELYMIGTPFDGVGMPDGVRQARELAQQISE